MWYESTVFFRAELIGKIKLWLPRVLGFTDPPWNILGTYHGRPTLLCNTNNFYDRMNWLISPAVDGILSNLQCKPSFFCTSALWIHKVAFTPSNAVAEWTRPQSFLFYKEKGTTFNVMQKALICALQFNTSLVNAHRTKNWSNRIRFCHICISFLLLLCSEFLTIDWVMGIFLLVF